MQNTTNFNFNLPEGTDLWNYLTQTNPNFTALDSILKSVQDGTVTTATEVTSGTAHAVTRTLPDANVIRFTATGAWTLGDTMTIDGTPVTVVKPNGTSLQTGDYIIGSEVLGVLRATQFTVYLGAPSSLDAADVSYNNTGSGLTATDVQDAIDEVNSKLSADYVEVIADGVITYQQAFNQLYSLLDRTKLNANSCYIESAPTAEYYYSITRNQSNNVRFSRTEVLPNLLYLSTAHILNTGSSLEDWNGSTHSSVTTQTVPAGRTLRIYYKLAR